MKKLITGIMSFVVICFVSYFSLGLYTDIKLSSVQEKITKHNPEITKIVKINSIGQWGEWFSEYSSVVEMNGQQYRIWTTNDGEITEKEAM